MWKVLGLLVSVLLVTASASKAEFPGDRITIVVPANPGGTNDIIARAVAPSVSESLGVPVIVENKIGSGGRLGAEAVVRAVPDGRTILMSASHIQATQKWVYRKNMRYDPETDLVPIAAVGISSNVLLVRSALPVNSVQELIAYAKKNPGKLSYASVGVGTSSHLSAELFKSMAGLDILHIPYNGSAPALKDLLGGEVDMQFENMPTALPHLSSGRVRPLAVTTKARSALLPELPTMEEAGLKGFEAAPWYCFVAPAKTPAPVIARLHAELEAAMQKPEVAALLERAGMARLKMTPSELGAFMAAENLKWKEIVEKSGATVD